METLSLESLCAAVKESKRADSSFEKATWEKVLGSLRLAVPDTSFEKRQLKLEINSLKEKYHKLQLYFIRSSFGHDLVNNLPIASPQVWEDYLPVSMMHIFVCYNTTNYLGASSSRIILL